MKFFHLSDLHIGKRLHEVSLLEDQRHILKQILSLAQERIPDAILIAGDIYDKSVPPAEGVTLFDDFLTGAAALGIPVVFISGNHDSPERLNFGRRLLEAKDIWLQGSFQGKLRRLSFEDAFGQVDIWMLPFVRAASVRPFFPELEIPDDHAAVAAIIADAKIDPSRRNVLLAHQFVTGSQGAPRRADSESVSVGNSDNIDCSVFSPFDYVALGHLHLPQAVGRETIRYCGSPLKYSFSEVKTPKSVTEVVLGKKGEISLTELPLTPLRDLREIRGPLEALITPQILSAADPEDYLRIILTDEQPLLNPADTLRRYYPNLLRLDFDNRRSRAGGVDNLAAETDGRPLEELFGEFYEKQLGAPMDAFQQKIVRQLFLEAEQGL